MIIKFLLKFLDQTFVLKAALVLLGVSLIFIGEIFLIEFISGFLGIYFTLAIAASTGFAGLFFSLREINSRINLIREEVSEGIYSEKDMVQLTGAFAGGLLLLIPGFITDALGVVSFFPVVRMLYGRLISKYLSLNLTEAYEYLRLYD